MWEALLQIRVPPISGALHLNGRQDCLQRAPNVVGALQIMQCCLTAKIVIRSLRLHRRLEAFAVDVSCPFIVIKYLLAKLRACRFPHRS